MLNRVMLIIGYLLYMYEVERHSCVPVGECNSDYLGQNGQSGTSFDHMHPYPVHFVIWSLIKITELVVSKLKHVCFLK